MPPASFDGAPDGGTVSRENELAFRLAATDACRLRERARIRALAGSVDYELLVRALDRQRLLSLAGHRLAELCPDEIPPAFGRLVEGRAAEARRRFVLYRHAAGDLARRMEGAGIEAVPLKGPLLAERIYPDPGLRAPSSDLDFLVRPERLDDAVELLRGFGYRIWDDTRWRRQLPHYHYGLIPPDATMPKVELHWRIHWYEELFGPAVIDRSVVLGDGLRAPGPADDLAILLIIYARDGFVGLRLPADIGAWWSARGETVQRDGFERLIAGYPELRSTLLTALDVSAEVVDLPAERLISKRWRPSGRARLAPRLVNWSLRGSEDAVANRIALVDLLLSPPSASGTYLRHYYLQPLEKYARDYGWRPEARVPNELRRAVRAPARLARRLARHAAEIWSLRGGARFEVVPGRTQASHRAGLAASSHPRGPLLGQASHSVRMQASTVKQPSPQPRALGLRPGDLVRVRSAIEIAPTLDPDGSLDGLPFMPEMLQYCDRTFHVSMRADKTCAGDGTVRRMHDAVHLAGLRCDGGAHDGCQAACRLYWKEAWLERVENGGDPAPAPNGHHASLHETLLAGTSVPSDDGPLYRCQATEIPRASRRLRVREVDQYVRDVRNWGLRKLLRGLVFDLINLWQHLSRQHLPPSLRIAGGRPYPFIRGPHPVAKGATPVARLDLRPGEMVRIKSKAEIEATLDHDNYNRGLFFDGEMAAYCGRTARVLGRVNRLVDEHTGKLIEINSDCILLDGVVCMADYHRLCQRGIYSYWREIWLERVEGPTDDEARGPRPAAGEGSEPPCVPSDLSSA